MFKVGDKLIVIKNIPGYEIGETFTLCYAPDNPTGPEFLVIPGKHNMPDRNGDRHGTWLRHYKSHVKLKECKSHLPDFL